MPVGCDNARVTARTRPAPYAGWRALAATVGVMVGAVSAHSWAGGGLPGPAGLAVLAGVVFAGGLLCLREDLHPLVAAPVVALAQAGLHVSFGLGDVAGVAVADHGAHVASGAGVGDPVWWSWQMLVAHLVSTLLTLAVWALCRRAASVLVSVLDGDRRPGPWQPRATCMRVVAPVLASAWLAGAPRRGPPAPTCCA